MPLLFTPEWLDELKSRCDIIDIISRYMALKRNGREWVGCCPFHHEKTPSFFVYPESQSYYCFGCKASGDVIQFISKYENIGFVEAVERLFTPSASGVPASYGGAEFELRSFRSLTLDVKTNAVVVELNATDCALTDEGD